MDDAKSFLDQLQANCSIKQQEKILGQLTKLIIELNNDDETDDNAVQEVIMQSPVIDLVLSHLDSGDKDEGGEPILIACSQFIAEFAKTETVREPLVKKGFMIHLLKRLPSQNVKLATQVCRALGNICFDNDEGRLAVDEADGIPAILNVMSNQIHNTDEGADQLRVILCGFLLNLTNNNELLQTKAIDANVLDLLNEVMLTHIQDQDLTNMTLLTLGSITEADSGKESLSHTGLLTTFKTLLDKKDPHLTGVLLDLLNNVMESEHAKDQAAEIGMCDSLISIINEDGEKESVKVASDVLVSILVGDNSMEHVYEGGKGKVFLQCLDWLESNDDALKTLGSLAIGNFARRDSYCVELVDRGIVGKLVPLLKSCPDSSFYLQHAVLSTLRNLAIPVNNKPRLQEQGVMDACLCLINSEVMAVIFKLLGLLRMLIEGQESAAVRLGQERAFSDCLCEWCSVEVHAGVKGEAPRLIASLIKNGKSVTVIQNLIQADCMGPLVAMAQCEHVVMQNEAVIALTIVCSTALGDAAVALKEAGLADVVAKLLKEEQMPAEVLCNVLSLAQAVMCAENLQEEIISSGVIDLVRVLCQGHLDPKVTEAAKETLTKMETALEGS